MQKLNALSGLSMMGSLRRQRTKKFSPSTMQKSSVRILLEV